MANTIFPVFFNAPHLLITGGTVAEPLNALMALGVNRSLAIGSIIGLSLFQLVALYRYWRSRKAGAMLVQVPNLQPLPL